MSQSSRMERFTGLTMLFNPLFTLIGTVYLSLTKTRGLLKKVKADRANLYFWSLLAISTVISVLLAINKSVALPSSLVPFFFIWLYILGRWVIQDPATFMQDLIRGRLFSRSLQSSPIVLTYNYPLVHSVVVQL